MKTITSPFLSLYYNTVSRLLYFFVLILNRTLKVKIRNLHAFRTIRRHKLKPIFAVWHQATFPLLYLYRHRGCAAFTSDGRRGEILTRCAAWLGYIPVQVPYTHNIRESARALRKMMILLETTHDAACVVDGPAGPCFEIKPGIFYLAAKTGRVIVPLHIDYDKKIQLLWRWDKYILPLPWSQVTITFGDPIAVDPAAAERDIKILTQKVTRSLDGQRS